MNKEKPREIACAILARSEAKGVHLDALLAEALPRLAPVDRGLCQELVYGVTRWRGLLDWLISKRTDGRRQMPEVQRLVRLGLYQLLWLDRVPDHAIVYETVEMARAQGLEAQGGFINAVLRNCARDKGALKAEMMAVRKTDLAAGYSHPGWLVERWCRRWDADRCRALLEWNNSPSATYARVNTLKADPGRLLDRWRMEEKVDYDFVRADWLEESTVFRLKSHPSLAGLASFREGWFYVQDPSTLLAVDLLDPQAGERILDQCAAPGGKATAIAARVNNEALVVARDTVARRLDLLRENCRRLGADCVEPELVSADAPTAGVPHRFDRILLDAPCSNTGVMRRRVELRWALDPEDLVRLSEMQLNLLERAAVQLQPGGVLVYSTCSLEPEENGGVIKAFLSRHPAFRLEQERELWPFRDGFDGAYAAVLQKSDG